MVEIGAIPPNLVLIHLTVSEKMGLRDGRTRDAGAMSN